MIDLGTSTAEAAAIQMSQLTRDRKEHEQDVNCQARTYFQQQANYWRAQGDEAYARECEAELGRW